MTKRRDRAKVTGRRAGGSFLALPHSILGSPEYAALSAQAVKLLVDIAAQYRGANNGDLCATWKTMHKVGWRSRATLAYAKAESLAAGFIEKTRDGGLRFPCLYAITWRATDECGGKLQIPASRVPSHLWRRPLNNLEIQKPDTPGVSTRHAGSVEKAAA